MSMEEDWKKKYDELRVKTMTILDNMDNIGFQIQVMAKNAKAEVLGLRQQPPVNRAQRRRQEEQGK